MTITALRDSFSASLKKIYSAGEAIVITDMILEHLTGTGRSQLLTKKNEPPSEALLAAAENALQQLLKFTPVQYVIGHAWFYGLKFLVNKNVLIPRPETEELAEEAIGILRSSPAKKLIDIGTGSGCIPVSIKKNIPQAEIWAIDISKEALAVAKENAAKHATAIEFLEMDFTDEKKRAALPLFDMIVSNPPYIPEEEKKSLDHNVTLHEPHTALFVPQDDPLLFYRNIKDFAEMHLNAGGYILLEVHENFAKETAALFSAEYDTGIKKDISGKERMVIATLCR